MRLITVSEAQRPILLRVLAKEATPNVLLLSWAERLGRDSAIAFWAIAAQAGFAAILGRHEGEWGVANPGEADLYPLAKILEKEGGRLRGPAEPVGALARHLQAKVQDQTSLLVELPAEANLACSAAGSQRRLAPEDLAKVPVWLTGPGPFPPLSGALAGGGRIVAIEADGILVAAAWTEAEYEGLALIGGLRVAPEHRRRGWGKACLAAPCRDLSAAGLRPQMAYDCPVLGRLAGEIGFIPMGRWRQILVIGSASTNASPEDSAR